MEVCDPFYRVGEEPALGGLAGLDLQHDLHLSVSDWTSWTSVTSLLHSLGAEVLSLQLGRMEGGFSLRCRLRRLSAEAARGLIGTLLDSGVADRASVEHLMLSKKAEGVR